MSGLVLTCPELGLNAEFEKLDSEGVPFVDAGLDADFVLVPQPEDTFLTRSSGSEFDVFSQSADSAGTSPGIAGIEFTLLPQPEELGVVGAGP